MDVTPDMPKTGPFTRFVRIFASVLKNSFYNISETNRQQNSKNGIVYYCHNERKKQEYYGKHHFSLQLFSGKKQGSRKHPKKVLAPRGKQVRKAQEA
jgi:hypothetical protein